MDCIQHTKPSSLGEDHCAKWDRPTSSAVSGFYFYYYISSCFYFCYCISPCRRTVCSKEPWHSQALLFAPGPISHARCSCRPTAPAAILLLLLLLYSYLTSPLQAETAHSLAAKLGCPTSPSSSLLDCLRTKKPEQLLEAEASLHSWRPGTPEQVLLLLLLLLTP